VKTRDRHNPQSKIYRLFCGDLLRQAGAGIGGTISLPPGEVHHALHVLRLAIGDEVEIFDGMGCRCRGVIASAGRSSVTVRIININDIPPRRRPAIHIGFAVPKGDRLDYLLEKATELAVASIEPVVFERSVAGGQQLSPAALARWQGQCISAGKQAGVDFLPSIAQMKPLAEWLTDVTSPLRLMGDLSEESRPLVQALPPHKPQSVHILVGPEGGIMPHERQMAMAAGFLPVRVGCTTLRIETAVVAMLAVTAAVYG